MRIEIPQKHHHYIHPKSYLEELEAEIVALKLFFKEDIRKTERRIAQAEELLRGEPASGKREGF